MAYRTNMEALKAASSANVRQAFNNANAEIKEIDRQSKESIDNIGKFTSLLTGSPGQAFKSGFEDREFVNPNEGVIPTLYGQRVRRKYKEGKEAEKLDRQERLLKLAAYVDALKDEDTEYHRLGGNMLLNGAYYEDKDRFTKLSPHAQVAYAQQKIGLYNDTLSDKLQYMMAKDTDTINYKGVEYNPADVHLKDDYPLLLKEHAINIQLERLREQNGINGFSEAMLDMGGVNDNPVTGEAGSERSAKDALMNKYRKRYNVDSSYKTRIQAIQEFQRSETKDLNRLLTIFANTVDGNNQLLGYAGAWDEAMKMLEMELVTGSMKDIDPKDIKKELGRQINPNDPKDRTYAETHPNRFDKLEADVKNARYNRAQADLKYHKWRQNKIESNFNDWRQEKEEADPNFVMTRSQFMAWDDVAEKAGFTATPTWLADAYYSFNRDDREDYSRIATAIGNGTFTPDMFTGVSHRVRRAFTQPRGEGGTSIVQDFNASGTPYANQVLKSGGAMAENLNDLIWQATDQLGIAPSDRSMGKEGRDARVKMENYLLERFDFHRNVKNQPDHIAMGLAYEDTKKLALPSKKEVELEGRKYTGDATIDSIFWKPIVLDREELYKEGEKVDIAYEWIKDRNLKTGSFQFLQSERIRGAKPYIQQAIDYRKGKIIQIPNYWQRLSEKFPGMSATTLMDDQITAWTGVQNPRSLNPRLLPTSDEVLNMRQYNEIYRYNNYKPTTCSRMQLKACIPDKGANADVQLKGIGGIQRDPNDRRYPDVPTDAAPTAEIQPQLLEPQLPEGYTLTESGGVRSDIGGMFSIENSEYWEHATPGDTRVINGETQTLGEDGKWTSPRIEVEDKYGTYNTAERTADVPLDILNSYGGDTLEARAKYLSAKERYEKEEADNKNPYKTVSLGLGVTPPIGTDSPRIDNRTIPGKNFDELSVEDHSKLDQTWFFESQIEAELGENWIKQFPLKDQNEIRKFEYRGVFNPATHYILRGPLKGTVFGIPWEIPGKGWRLVPREKVHNLQSTLTSPDSPFLAEGLRDYSAQLFDTHVLTNA